MKAKDIFNHYDVTNVKEIKFFEPYYERIVILKDGIDVKNCECLDGDDCPIPYYECEVVGDTLEDVDTKIDLQTEETGNNLLSSAALDRNIIKPSSGSPDVYLVNVDAFDDLGDCVVEVAKKDRPLFLSFIKDKVYTEKDGKIHCKFIRAMTILGNKNICIVKMVSDTI